MSFGQSFIERLASGCRWHSDLASSTSCLESMSGEELACTRKCARLLLVDQMCLIEQMKRSQGGVKTVSSVPPSGGEAKESRAYEDADFEKYVAHRKSCGHVLKQGHTWRKDYEAKLRKAKKKTNKAVVGKDTASSKTEQGPTTMSGGDGKKSKKKSKKKTKTKKTLVGKDTAEKSEVGPATMSCGEGKEESQKVVVCKDTESSKIGEVPVGMSGGEEKESAVTDVEAAWTTVVRRSPTKKKQTPSKAPSKAPSKPPSSKKAKSFAEFCKGRKFFVKVKGVKVYAQDATEAQLRKLQLQKEKMYSAYLKRVEKKAEEKAEEKASKKAECKDEDEPVMMCGGEAKADPVYNLTGDVMRLADRLREDIRGSEDPRRLRMTGWIVLNGSGKKLSKDVIQKGFKGAVKTRQMFLSKIRKKGYRYIEDPKPVVKDVPAKSVLPTKRCSSGEQSELMRDLSDQGMALWYKFEGAICYAIVAADPRLDKRDREILEGSIMTGMTPSEYADHMAPERVVQEESVSEVDDASFDGTLSDEVAFPKLGTKN